jgi:hypothetical protein
MQNNETARELRQDELRPADVLLSRGHGLVSDLIANVDGGSYSHGAVWSGEGVIQATSDGITHSAAKGEHGVYRRIDLPDEVASEIVEVAKSQLEGRYAYGELVLLGLLFSSGMRVNGDLLPRMLEAIGGPTASKLKAWLDQRPEAKARICTELVASSYFKAAGGRLALHILPVSKRRAVEPASVLAGLPPLSGDGASSAGTRRDASSQADQLLTEQAAAASRRCRELLVERGLFQAAMTRGAAVELPLLGPEGAVESRKVFSGPIALDAVTGKAIGVVTPADLEYSPSLRFVGYLKA